MRRKNVCGTAYGVKRTAGSLQPELAYIVYVSSKKPQGRLASADRIPPKVTRLGMTLPTDVVELGSLRLHSLYNNLAKPRFIRDDITPGGTVTSFIRTGADYFALSCAHVIWGADRDPNTESAIQIYEAEKGEWIHLGASAGGVRDVGRGYAPDFGYLDAGLASISNPTLRKACAGSTTRRGIHPSSGDALDLSQVQDLPVFANSLVSDKRVEGIVTSLHFVHPSGVRFDLVIEREDRREITFPGDSGLLWIDHSGRAVAMHVMGEGDGPQTGSRVSLCTFMYRVLKRFDAEALC